MRPGEVDLLRQTRAGAARGAARKDAAAPSTMREWVTRWFNLALLARVDTATTCDVDASEVMRRVEASHTGKKLDQYMSDVFTAARREPYNARLMDEIACLLRSINARGPASRSRSRSRGTSPEAILFRSGTSVAVPGVFQDEYRPLVFPPDHPPAFVLKTVPENVWREDTSPYVDNAPLLNEALVGIYALNALRSKIPTFMHVFAAYTAPRATIRGRDIAGGSALTLFQGDQAAGGGARSLVMAPEARTGRALATRGFAWYNMVETIADSPTLGQWLRSGLRAGTIHEVVAQVLLALGVANSQLGGFSHGRLSLDTVLVTPLSHRVTIAFPISGEEVAYVETAHLARIVDFENARTTIAIRGGAGGGRAAVTESDAPIAQRYPEEKERFYLATGVAGSKIVLDAAGLPDFSPDPLRDVVDLIRAVEPLIEDDDVIAAWMAPLLGDEVPDLVTMDAWARATVPTGVTVDPAEVVRAALASLPRSARVRVEFRERSQGAPPGYARLLACGTHVCEHMKELAPVTSSSSDIQSTTMNSTLLGDLARKKGEHEWAAATLTDLLQRAREINYVYNARRQSRSFFSFLLPGDGRRAAPELVAESRAVLSELTQLSQHSDPEIRAAASRILDAYDTPLRYFRD